MEAEVSAARRVVLVDLMSSVEAGGHTEEQLVTLTEVFKDSDLTVIAPYLQGRPEEPRERLGGIVTSFRAFRRALKKPAGSRSVLVAPSPNAIDFVTCWCAAATLRPRERSACLMVLRRDPITIARNRHPLLGKAFARLVAHMMRRHMIYLAADSQIVLDTWLELVPGSSGSVVGVTVLPDPPEGSTQLTLVEPAGPLVALTGDMRDDKGAMHYPSIAEAVLAEFPDGAIAIQTSDSDAAAATATAVLEQRFASEARVQLISDYLSTDEYAQLMHATDIFVLPYDPVAYGGGSSGIVTDALASGGLVVSTPLPWARSEFADEPSVVWIDDPSDMQQLRAALREAQNRSASSSHSRQKSLERFAASWQDAASAAEKDAELRSR
ncbi:MAG: hypothetical protein JHC98_00740 [Thermoleophilaceae bacterium]|nr:hypothetical protein [Thermoleophilaceae bacterium]